MIYKQITLEKLVASYIMAANKQQWFVDHWKSAAIVSFLRKDGNYSKLLQMYFRQCSKTSRAIEECVLFPTPNLTVDDLKLLHAIVVLEAKRDNIIHAYNHIKDSGRSVSSLDHEVTTYDRPIYRSVTRKRHK